MRMRYFFFQAEDGIRDLTVTGVQTCALPICNLVDALAPSNNPVVNPAAWKAAIDTGGGSALTGPRRLLSDRERGGGGRGGDLVGGGLIKKKKKYMPGAEYSLQVSSYI